MKLTLGWLLGIALVSLLLATAVGIAAASPEAQDAVRCTEGLAAGYPCQDVHLLSHLPLDELGTGVATGSDHWGWTDPVTGRDYVLFGLSDGTSFVDISDRGNPLYLGKLPSHDSASVWRDIKTYHNYAYIVADIPTNHGLQVFDLTELRGISEPPVVFAETAHYGGFGAGHNLWIDRATGYAYVFRTGGDSCNAGIHMVDIRDPLHPTFAGCLDENDAPLSDAECLLYDGPDGDYAGHEICFTGSDDNVSIGDVTDKSAPTLIASFTYPGIARAHQGALTADRRFWLLSDTMDEEINGHNTRTYVIDVADLDAPQFLGYYEHPTTARDHNLYIVDSIAYQTNWKAGLRVLDISSLPSTTLNPIGFFDIAPDSDSIASSGAWSNYPWWRDRVVTVSGTQEGLFVLGPVLPPRFSTFLGGALAEQGESIALDGEGNVYVTGFTESVVFPEAERGQGARSPEAERSGDGKGQTANGAHHGIDAFVAKFNADGSTLEYLFWFDAVNATYEDQAYGVAVDDAGNAYVVGQTRSPDFCSVFGEVPGYDTSYNGDGDAFVFKVKADGSGLSYCTYLGGSDWDTGRAIAVDGAGNATVTGGTWSTDFPTTAGGLQPGLAGQRDSFVARLDPDGLALDYATYLGGSGQEESRGVAIDRDHNAYVVGWTNSSDFYTSTNALDPTYGGGFDAFLVKLSTTGDSLGYATYLGGADEDRPTGVRVDGVGAATVAGYTRSPQFPTTPGALDESYNGGYDGFVVKVTPPGSDLIYGTLLGGAGEDWVRGVDVDARGVTYLAGETWSSDFPTTTMALGAGLLGDRDGFLAQLSTGGSRLLASTYLGGSGWDQGSAVAAGPNGHAYVTGATASVDFPATSQAYDGSHNGSFDVFISKLAVVDPVVPPLCADFQAPAGVGVEDIVAVAEHWGQVAANGNARFDLDGDGVIRVADIQLAAAQWGTSCPR